MEPTQEMGKESFEENSPNDRAERGSRPGGHWDGKRNGSPGAEGAQELCAHWNNKPNSPVRHQLSKGGSDRFSQLPSYSPTQGMFNK